MLHKTKMQKKREALSAKVRKTTLFHYRIVITLPPWGVLVMAGAVGVGLVSQPMLVTNIVSVAATGIAVVFCVVARRIVKALRFEVHEALNNIGSDELELTDYEPKPETIRLKKMGHTNGSRSSRVSE